MVAPVSGTDTEERQVDVLTLADLAAFARDQSLLLKTLYHMGSEAELAQVCVMKLQEEMGEVAEAYLAFRRLQRPDKLKPNEAEMLSDLGAEIADVVLVAAILARNVGLTIDGLVADRIRTLRSRRAGMVNAINRSLAELWDRSHADPDQLAFPLAFE